jgi:hypothetical protein
MEDPSRAQRPHLLVSHYGHSHQQDQQVCLTPHQDFLRSRSASAAGLGWLEISTPGLDPLLAYHVSDGSTVSALQT